jgi:hypothetical protein
MATLQLSWKVEKKTTYPAGCTPHNIKSSVFRNCLRYRYMEGAAHLPKGLCCETKPNEVYPIIDKAAFI